MSRIVQPSVRETAFNCPYCFAFTTQSWYDLYAKRTEREDSLPFVIGESEMKNIVNQQKIKENKELLELFKKLRAGIVLISQENKFQEVRSIDNVYLSVCYNCKRIAVW